jgi:hypothetical protein
MRRPLLLAVLAVVVLVFAGSHTASPAVWHSLPAVSFAPPLPGKLRFAGRLPKNPFHIGAALSPARFQTSDPSKCRIQVGDLWYCRAPRVRLATLPGPIMLEVESGTQWENAFIEFVS